MPCGCRGGTRQGAGDRRSVPTTSGDVAAGRVPGMPKYKVDGGSADPDRTFDTYVEAKAHRSSHGGEIVPVDP